MKLTFHLYLRSIPPLHCLLQHSAQVAMSQCNAIKELYVFFPMQSIYWSQIHRHTHKHKRRAWLKSITAEMDLFISEGQKRPADNRLKVHTCTHSETYLQIKLEAVINGSNRHIQTSCIKKMYLIWCVYQLYLKAKCSNRCDFLGFVITIWIRANEITVNSVHICIVS